MDARLIENQYRGLLHAESKQDRPSYDERKAAGTNMEQEQHPQSHLFTLRIWEETLGDGRAEWRGRVHNVVGGETLFFRDWPGLIATLQRLIAGAPSAQENASGEPLFTRETHESDHESFSCP